MPILLDDVCRNKAAIIERSIRRALEEYRNNPELDNFTHIDAMTLNIERFCQGAIDLSMHIVAREHLGMPQTSAEAFKLLLKANILSQKTTKAMVAMVGFRNVAVHEYQDLDLNVLRVIAKERWQDAVEFCRELGLVIRP